MLQKLQNETCDFKVNAQKLRQTYSDHSETLYQEENRYTL